LRGNLITGTIDLQGNSGLLQPTADLAENNTIITNEPVVIRLRNSNSSTVHNNEILGSANSGIGIQVRSNSDYVTISGHHGDDRHRATFRDRPDQMMLRMPQSRNLD
jgi:hypothetical protein